ncbi:hypothetical protein ANN_18467 [Periplaneta americana]|uniref:Uncharacterized protein n=1 Tax=Periplaneta americana TaxID=6978 RepID=A0ABQ8SPB6_PERAM|nr:hypothetical protein ANN_18467 [Periplaneta americana]
MSRAVASWSKASCLGLALRKVRWFESSWGKKFSHEISTSVWDRCPPSIVMHLGSYDSIGRSIAADLAFRPWPSRSPDLTPCDFFRWEYMKYAVYVPYLSQDFEEVILRRFINILGYLASECDEGDNADEMSPGSSNESCSALAHIGLRENPGKNLNQIPYAHRPNHVTPLTTGPYSRQNPYTIPASANSPKAPLSVRGETLPRVGPSRVSLQKSSNIAELHSTEAGRESQQLREAAGRVI